MFLIQKEVKQILIRENVVVNQNLYIFGKPIWFTNLVYQIAN